MSKVCDKYGGEEKNISGLRGESLKKTTGKTLGIDGIGNLEWTICLMTAKSSRLMPTQ